jgi:hypothetical protein
MKSIKNQYIALKEGKMTEAQFMRNVRMSLPQYISNVTLFKQAEKILINKGIISEIKDTIVEETDNEKLERYKKYTYVLDGKKVIPDNIDYFNNYLGVELDGKYYTIGSPNEDGIVQIKPRVGKTGIYTEVNKSSNIQKLIDAGYSESDAEDLADEFEQGGVKVPQKVKDILKEAKDESATGYYNQDGKEQYGKFDELDNMNAQEIMAGYVLEKIDNPDKDKMEICKLVIKNLKKDQFYYTNYKLTGVRDQQPTEFTSTKRKPGFDQTEEVSKKADNLKDTKNATTIVKEGLSEYNESSDSMSTDDTKETYSIDKTNRFDVTLMNGKHFSNVKFINRNSFTTPNGGTYLNQDIRTVVRSDEKLDEAQKSKLKMAIRKVMKEMFDGMEPLSRTGLDENTKALENLEVGDVFRVVKEKVAGVRENTNYEITMLGNYLLDFKTVKNPEHAALGQTGTMSVDRFKENVLSGDIIIYPK